MRCYGCDCIVDTRGLCNKCWKSIVFIDCATCARCGYPFSQDVFDNESDVGLECFECQRIKPLFNIARSVCNHGDIISSIISKLKYHDEIHIAHFISQTIYRLYNEMNLSVDIICPVPMDKKSLTKRMYNQSYLIAKKFASLVKMQHTLIPNLLIKNRITSRQVTLDRQRRLNNMKNSISINKRYAKLLSGKTILIIDDVFTTGATMQECARAIKSTAHDAIVACLTFSRVIIQS